MFDSAKTRASAHGRKTYRSPEQLTGNCSAVSVWYRAFRFLTSENDEFQAQTPINVAPPIEETAKVQRGTNDQLYNGKRAYIDTQRGGRTLAAKNEGK